MTDALEPRLFNEIAKIPILDSHSHIEPLHATARSLDDLLGYHYYTELAHSAGMKRKHLQSDVEPRERCRTILRYADRFDNTAQYSWLLEIARTFLGFTGDRLTEADSDGLFDRASEVMNESGWEARVIAQTNLERVFLTNSFDAELSGFDNKFFVPCLRTDDLVFNLGNADVQDRLCNHSGQDVGDLGSLRAGIFAIFKRFQQFGARACAISLPPHFEVLASIGHRDDAELERELAATFANGVMSNAGSVKVFWILAEACREFGLPFVLMIGVNRRVYRDGVHQGQDLFDQRCSLLQFATLFNDFPRVKFPVSVLSSGQNQELVSNAWIFPNVYPHGHWWYSNVPPFIESDLRARLAGVPKYKLLGYYSDAYKLEFVLPKYNMYRRSLARVLTDDFVRPGRLSESGAVDLARTILRDNVERLFKLSAQPIT